MLEVLENPMKIIPSKNVVICTKLEAKPTKSGIIIPEDDKARNEIGKVYAIGEGKPPIPLKVGDEIIFQKYTDNRVDVGGDEFNLIEFKNIMAKIKR